MTKPRPAASSHTRFLTATRTLGAVALLVAGGVHFQQYRYEFYSTIPTIGPLFLANFVAASALGLFLLSPVRSPGRLGTVVDQLAALAGAAVAAGAFVGLVVSEHTPLFGFSEHGYRFAIVLALASEGVVTVTLALFLIGERKRARISAPPSARKRSGDAVGGTAAQTALTSDPAGTA